MRLIQYFIYQGKKLKTIIIILIILFGLQSIFYFSTIDIDKNSLHDKEKFEIFRMPKQSINEEYTTLWKLNQYGIGKDIIVDDAGNIFIAGSGDLDPSTGLDDGLVLVKFDDMGNEIWNNTYGIEYTFGEAVDLDNSGNAYVAGYTNDYGAGAEDACLVKFNSSGGIEWNITWGFPDYEYAFGVGVDSDDYVYISGISTDWNTIYDIFLVKFNSSGKEEW